MTINEILAESVEHDTTLTADEIAQLVSAGVKFPKVVSPDYDGGDEDKQLYSDTKYTVGGGMTTLGYLGVESVEIKGSFSVDVSLVENWNAEAARQQIESTKYYVYSCELRERLFERELTKGNGDGYH